MARKVITFLGKYPKQTTYLYKGQTYQGRVFAEALRQFATFDQMLVFTTDEAKTTTWPVLAALQDTRIQSVPIPIGVDEAQLWALFNTLTRQVAVQDTVIFDITHGLRSIPFLVFLAAAYLKEARDVTIEAIYYGAFELGNEKEGEPAPVIDLSGFVSLLNWLTATNQFIYTGDARYLAHLLTEEGVVCNSPVLKKAGNRLQSLSLAMMLCRPLEVMEEAGKLEGALEHAEKELARWAQPFGLLADRIRAEYAARALPHPTEPENVAASLRQQLALIHWYLDNNQIIQAMSLAREWVVTASGWKLGRGFLLNMDEREVVGRGLSGLLRLDRKKETGEVFGIDDLNAQGRTILGFPEGELLRTLWGNLTGVRNELDHVGMNPNPSKAAKLARKAQEQIRPVLDELATKWDITEATP